MQNSKHLESPKLELSKSQNSSTNSRIYKSLIQLLDLILSILSNLYLSQGLSYTRQFEFSMCCFRSPEAVTDDPCVFYPFIVSNQHT